jgi:YggT family protein
MKTADRAPGWRAAARKIKKNTRIPKETGYYGPSAKKKPGHRSGRASQVRVDMDQRMIRSAGASVGARPADGTLLATYRYPSVICIRPNITRTLALLRTGGAAARFRARVWSVRQMITTLFWLLLALLNLYWWAVLLAAVFSTLASFGVIDTRNRIVWTIGDFLYRITEPALRRIRNIMPNFGSVDLSPLVLLLLVQGAIMITVRIEQAIMTGAMQYLL